MRRSRLPRLLYVISQLVVDSLLSLNSLLLLLWALSCSGGRLLQDLPTNRASSRARDMAACLKSHLALYIGSITLDCWAG